MNNKNLHLQNNQLDCTRIRGHKSEVVSVHIIAEDNEAIKRLASAGADGSLLIWRKVYDGMLKHNKLSCSDGLNRIMHFRRLMVVVPH